MRALFDTYESKAIRSSLDRFISKCVEFCWRSALEEPIPQLISNPRKECPALIDKFEGFKTLSTDYVVQWPAVVQGKDVKSTWRLYDIKRERKVVPTTVNPSD